MEVRVLYFDGCPHVSEAVDLIKSIVGDRSDVHFTTLAINSPKEAADFGMHGSPTIVIDGVDPFSERDCPTSLSCRVYVSESGISGVPPADRLSEALAR